MCIIKNIRKYIYIYKRRYVKFLISKVIYLIIRMKNYELNKYNYS